MVAIPTRTILIDDNAEDGSPPPTTTTTASRLDEESSVSASVVAKAATATETGIMVTIRLTRIEQALFDLLCQVAATATPSVPTPTTTNKETTAEAAVVVRVAGGWVRDKILQGSSSSSSSFHTTATIGSATTTTTAATAAAPPINDIDITTSSLSGVKFATLVQAHILLLQQQQQQHTPSIRWHCGSLGVIAANPEQSKHLETATLRLTATAVVVEHPTHNTTAATATTPEPTTTSNTTLPTPVVVSLDLDFCALRGQEVYTDQQSRIPSALGVNAATATPFDDAMRRDFTCNALFYNLHTCQVEDYIPFHDSSSGCSDSNDTCNTSNSGGGGGGGLRDLQLGRLKTPWNNPATTLTDDPLRVLRAVRFAVRYSWTLDAALRAAARQESIHAALRQKVSRERVGKELDNMISRKRHQQQHLAVAALTMIADLDLQDSVFVMPQIGIHCTSISGSICYRSVPNQQGNDFPPLSNNTKTSQCPISVDHNISAEQQKLAWEESLRLLSVVPAVWDDHTKMIEHSEKVTSLTTRADYRLLALASFLLPFRKLAATELPKTSGQSTTIKTFSIVTFMIKESIKFKNVDVQAVTILATLVDDMVDLIGAFAGEQQKNGDPKETAKCRLDAGLLIRQAKELWPTVVLLATVLLLSGQPVDNDIVTTSTISVSPLPITNWISVGNDWCTSILNMELDHVWKMRPLLDGKALIAALNIPRGPSVGVYMDEQVRWMLQHYPNGTLSECTAHLQSKQINLDSEPSCSSETPNAQSNTNKNNSLVQGACQQMATTLRVNGPADHQSKRLRER